MVAAGQALAGEGAAAAVAAVQAIVHFAFVAVSAGDQQMLAVFQQALGALVGAALGQVGEQARFRQVRRGDGGARQQPLAHGEADVALAQRTPPPARSTGSQTTGKCGWAARISATVSTISSEPSIPSLTAATGRSASTALAWASTHSRSRTRKSLTLTVSCTVSAVTAGRRGSPGRAGLRCRLAVRRHHWGRDRTGRALRGGKSVFSWRVSLPLKALRGGCADDLGRRARALRDTSRA